MISKTICERDLDKEKRVSDEDIESKIEQEIGRKIE